MMLPPGEIMSLFYLNGCNMDKLMNPVLSLRQDETANTKKGNPRTLIDEIWSSRGMRAKTITTKAISGRRE